MLCNLSKSQFVFRSLSSTCFSLFLSNGFAIAVSHPPTGAAPKTTDMGMYDVLKSPRIAIVERYNNDIKYRRAWIQEEGERRHPTTDTRRYFRRTSA